MVANDIKIFVKMKSKDQLGIEKIIQKFEKEKLADSFNSAQFFNFCFSAEILKSWPLIKKLVL